MRPLDAVKAGLMHHLAPVTVRYGEELRFAGSHLPAPEKLHLPTRYGDVRAFRYRGPGRGTVVHCYGGAFLMRHAAMDDWWCRYLVATTGATVVNLDFRAGPYVRYPVAQHECHDAAAHLAGGGGPVVVSGFSSGGQLAASVCLQARDRGTFAPVLQVLGVPALDLAAPVDPNTGGAVAPALRELVRRTYFPDAARRTEPTASPLLADDLTGMPPAVVLTAEHDGLRPDGEAWADRLEEAGVEVVRDCTPGADHYFLNHDLERAHATLALVATEVSRSIRDAG